MREMKDSGVQWVGLIPNDWNTVSLKYLCSMQSGKTLSSEEISDEGDYPVYGGNGLRGYYTQSNTIGDYLLVGRQGALCGNVHSVQGEFWATEHAIVTKCSSLSDKKFLYYLLLGMNLNQYASNTAAQPGLAVSTIVNIPTCLVPIHEQIKIAEMLDHKCTQVDALITNVQAQIEKLKAYKQSVITEVITKGLEPTVPMKDSGVEWIGEIPEHWEIKRGKALFKETEARSVDGSEELLTVSQYTGITPRSQKNVTMFEALSLEGYKICEVGDIAANTMWLWAGAIGVSEYRGVISPSYNVYRQRGNYFVPKYLDHLLRAPMLVQEYASLSTGIRASRLRLYPKDFFNIMFPVPPIEEQQAILDALSSKFYAVDRLIAIKQAKIEKLEQYKRSIIYEYVTGKREVI